MSTALTRGRTLDPRAVETARRWREDHINSLIEKRNKDIATLKELRELRWKWGIEPGEVKDE